MPENKSLVSASVVVHKTARHLLEQLMNSLEASGVARVYVIDNSPDDVLRTVAESFPLTEYHKVDNRGYGAGHNVAIRKAMEAGYDYHLVVNPDVRWTDPVIETLTRYMDTHPGVGQMMPKVYYPDGSLQAVCRKLPTPFDMFMRRFLPESWFARRRKRYLMLDCDYDAVMNPRYLLGSFMFFRLEALRRVGLFDERFFMYPEDIDITRRIHTHYDTLYYPAVSIIHDHARASRTSGRMLRIHIINMVRYFNKWGWLIDRERRDDWKTR